MWVKIGAEQWDSNPQQLTGLVLTRKVQAPNEFRLLRIARNGGAARRIVTRLIQPDAASPYLGLRKGFEPLRAMRSGDGGPLASTLSQHASL